MPESLFVMGRVEDVVRELIELDQTAAAIGVVLDEMEEDFTAHKPWDTPPVLRVCTRQLPPEEVAEEMERLGGTLMGLMVQEMRLLPPELMARMNPAVLMASMTKVMSEHPESFGEMLGEGGIDLMAWVLIYEAWESEAARDPQTGKPVEHVPPSEDPNRLEVRVAMAVDRAGYRYTIRRIRDGERVMFVDSGPLGSDGDKRGWQASGHSLMEALMAMMDATPEPPA